MGLTPVAAITDMEVTGGCQVCGPAGSKRCRFRGRQGCHRGSRLQEPAARGVAVPHLPLRICDTLVLCKEEKSTSARTGSTSGSQSSGILSPQSCGERRSWEGETGRGGSERGAESSGEGGELLQEEEEEGEEEDELGDGWRLRLRERGAHRQSNKCVTFCRCPSRWFHIGVAFKVVTIIFTMSLSAKNLWRRGASLGPLRRNIFTALLRLLGSWAAETQGSRSSSSSSSSSSSLSSSISIASMYVVVVATLALPVAANGFCPRGCLCNDVELSVQCLSANLTVVPILLNPRISKLNLKGNMISSLTQSFVFFHELRSLDLSHNELTNLGKENFKYQENLMELRIGTNRITEVSANTFQGLTSLETLHLDSNRISVVRENAFDGLVNLRELDMASNQLNSIHENAFSALQNLQILDLRENKISVVPSASFHNLQNLRQLLLGSNQISLLSDQAFEALPNLTHLVFDRNNISALGSSAFAGLSELRALSLADNRLSQVPTSSFDDLPTLDSLDLSGNLFETLDADFLAGLIALTSLTISRCPRLVFVSSDAFLGAPALRNLTLCHNPRLSVLGGTALAPLLHLRHLDLSASGFVYLHPTQIPLDRLKTLRISGNPLHCNCSLVWLARLAAQPNSSLRVEQTYCASPPNLYGTPLHEISSSGLIHCGATFSMLTVLTCLGVIFAGFLVIAAFVACRLRKSRRGSPSASSSDASCKSLWMWSPRGGRSGRSNGRGSVGGRGGRDGCETSVAFPFNDEDPQHLQLYQPTALQSFTQISTHDPLQHYPLPHHPDIRSYAHDPQYRLDNPFSAFAHRTSPMHHMSDNHRGTSPTTTTTSLTGRRLHPYHQDHPSPRLSHVYHPLLPNLVPAESDHIYANSRSQSPLPPEPWEIQRITPPLDSPPTTWCPDGRHYDCDCASHKLPVDPPDLTLSGPNPGRNVPVTYV
ncbi:uncharacterized protein LOC143025386 [Oratosquilla oratoria]|uniref:uncharacterized protein LOC143025386 n=1 Tax=Oratosquilla oratoria TaxID=337810 RepID=UPI003F76C904